MHSVHRTLFCVRNTMRWPHTRTHYSLRAKPSRTHMLLHLLLCANQTQIRTHTAMKCDRKETEKIKIHIWFGKMFKLMSEASSLGFLFSFLLLLLIFFSFIFGAVVEAMHVCVCVHKIVYAASAEHTYFSLLSFLFILLGFAPSIVRSSSRCIVGCCLPCFK